MESDKMIFQLSEETQKALADKFRAEAEYYRAQALVELEYSKEKKALSERARAEADADIQGFIKRMKQYELDKDLYLSSDIFNRIYRFESPVSFASVNQCISTLNYWHRNDEKSGELKPIEIIFYSPGGEITPGMKLFDHIRYISSLGHHVTTSTFGYAASMGAILLQAGDVRKMGNEAMLLIHEGSLIAWGTTAEVEDSIERMHIFHKRVIDIFTSRAKQTGRKTAITPGQFRRRWRRKDWWLDSSEAYKLGIVDELV